MRSLVIAALSVAAFGAAAPAQDSMTFQVDGGNPGGGGAYKGEVEVTKLGSATAKARWTTGTGANKQVVDGIAIKTKNGIGAAYGGKALYALALYTINGKSIDAVWTTAAAPKESNSYALKGSDFEGALSFADGTPGTVTFTPVGENVYKVVWQLSTGRYEGVGVRKGDLLAAASGEPGGAFGVATYVPKGDLIEGVWAMNGAKAAGTEVWSEGGSSGSTTAATAPVGDGTKVTFGGDTYTLKDKKSAPGQPTAELREYLRDGESFEDYRKMIGLRTHVTPVDAATMAKAVLAQVQKEHPNSYVKEISLGAEASTVMFILVVGDQVELNLWQYQKAKGGLASAQFVLRNKPPYETQKKFKAEQDKNLDQWLEELTALAGQAHALVTASAGAALAPPSAPPAKSSSEEISPELVKAIKADQDKCGQIAMEFMSHLKAGATDKAVALMHDSAFASTSRDAFAAQLAKSNVVFGELKSFKPDKKSTTFEMKDGRVNFYLHADSEYANANVHEVLRFVRNKAGDIEFVGYNRTAKE
jgi:hypothetical protein